MLQTGKDLVDLLDRFHLGDSRVTQQRVELISGCFWQPVYTGLLATHP
jgi:hypothetical protein